MDLGTNSQSDASDFKLGDWWVRPQRNELERGEEAVRVEARSMGVLVCLGRYAPEVVSKERLIEEVWRDSPFVGDDVLSHAIWELRKALGDSARNPVYIQTVPRKGYRLIAELLRPQGSPLPMEGVRIDHYDLGREIGRGAMGVVFEAVDRRLGRTVAIKFLATELTRDPQACARFEREARLAASLEHPNLATVHEVGETSQGHRYLVSSYYRGGSLKERLAAGPVVVEEAVRWGRQLIAGLGAAHQREIVHRDVKPANLLLDGHGTLKICDFGIAKLLGGTDLTRTGAAVGTPAYKSPEQARGLAVDHRTDLWAVGVVLYELLTGKRPFLGDDETTVVEAILSREPGSLEGERAVPEALREVIVKALAKDPGERFQSAEEMSVALDASVMVPEWEPPVRPGPRRRWLLAGAVLLALLVVGLVVLGWLTAQRRSSRGAPSSREGLQYVAQGADDSREGRDLLVQGRRLWLRGNHPANLQQVRELFEEAVELLPRSAEAKAQLAAFLAESYALDEREEDRLAAARLIDEALVLDPGSSLALAARSWLLLSAGDTDFEEQERLARLAVKIEPRCGRDGACDLGYLWLAEALWRQGEAEEAVKTLEEGIGVGGGYIRCRLKLAQYFERLGERLKAETAYEEVRRWDESQTTALHGLANFYLRSERYLEAAPLLEEHYRVTKDPDVLNSLGAVYYEKKRWDRAIEIYRQAHDDYREAGRLVPSPLMNIGDIYLEQGKRSEAEPWYLQALEVFDAMANPGARRLAQRAVCLAKLGRIEEAETEIQSLLDASREDDFPQLLEYAARVHALAGDREKLFETARRYVEEKGQQRSASRFLDDPAFNPYREDPEYLAILEPELVRNF